MGNIVKNSSLYLLSTVCLKATSFLLLPFYSYLITPDVYGKVFVVNALISFLSLLMPLALNTSVHRFFFNCKNLQEEKSLYSTIVWTATLSVILFSLIMLLLAEYWAKIFEIPIYYISISTITSALSVYYSIATSFFYAKQKAKTISIVTIIVGLIQIVVQFCLVIYMDDKALALIITFLVNSIVSFLIFLFFSKNYLRFTFDLTHLRIYLIYGFSQLPSDISVKVVAVLDRFILNKFINSSAVGLYGLGYTLGTIPSVLFSAVNQALVPTIYEDYKEDSPTSVKRAVVKVEVVYTLITIIFSLIIVYSNNIITILSDKYKDSSTIMCIVLFALLIDTYRILFMYPMGYKVEFVKIKSFIWVLSAILSTILNLLLIPKLSIYGAAFSFLISNIVTLFMILYFSHKAIPLHFNVTRLVLVFLGSSVFSLSVTLGSNLGAFCVKVAITVLYLGIMSYLLLKNYPFLTDLISKFKK